MRLPEFGVASNEDFPFHCRHLARFCRLICDPPTRPGTVGRKPSPAQKVAEQSSLRESAAGVLADSPPKSSQNQRPRRLPQDGLVFNFFSSREVLTPHARWQEIAGRCWQFIYSCISWAKTSPHCTSFLLVVSGNPIQLLSTSLPLLQGTNVRIIAELVSIRLF